ncbi:alpha/beta hydrolase [Brevibacillus brevis]|uniref:alpha/beta fold hydrolase n=1 Tax=Brevibacillus brevis TaxID=1393 RepID=UPI001F2E43BD|nr:alpha/beta hydrolase [Brevibacillus brevis]UIO42843.1 alpha/beta hydrolase [Brevibacillus brevis]
MTQRLTTASGHYVPVGGNVNLYVEDVGEGKPVVFIHGLPVGQAMYEYQRNVLPFKGIRYIGIDLRGFGKSDRPFNGYSYNQFADDIRHVFEQLEIENATLVGFSMGGAVAVRYMARHQGYGVSKLVLASAATPLFTQRPDYPYGLPVEVVESLVEAAQQDRPQLIEGFNSSLFHQKPSQAFVDWYNRMSLETDPIALAMSLKCLAYEDSREELAQIHVPVRIFQGKHDTMSFEPQINGLPNAKVIVFEESGHGLVFEEKDKFNIEILKFVEA